MLLRCSAISFSTSAKDGSRVGSEENDDSLVSGSGSRDSEREYLLSRASDGVRLLVRERRLGGDGVLVRPGERSLSRTSGRGDGLKSRGSLDTLRRSRHSFNASSVAPRIRRSASIETRSFFSLRRCF